MKNKIKYILIICIVSITVLSLFACANKRVESIESNEKVNLEVAVVLKTLSSEYWNYVKTGCEDAASELNIKLKVLGPNSESDIEGQVSMIEQQLGIGVDAIVVAPNDKDAAISVLQKAIDSNIPVLAVDTNVGINGQTTFVGTSNEDAAYLGGIYVAEKFTNKNMKPNAVIIYGQEGDNTSNMRRSGYRKAMNEYGINILTEMTGQNTTEGATKTMEDLLNAYPNSIDIVLCHNDDTAIGAMMACKSANIEDVSIIGFDGNKSAVDLVLTNDLTATVAQQPYLMGKQVIEAAYKTLKGEKVDSIIDSPAKVVDKNNANDYLGELNSLLR